MEYFVKLNIAFGLLYILYRFLLMNDTRLNLRRMYLLAIVPISFLLPLIEIQMLVQSELSTNVQQYVYTFDSDWGNSPVVALEKSFDRSLLFWFLYACIVVVLLFRMLRAIAQIRQLVKRSPQKKKGAYIFVPDSNVTLPYSFFQYIFVGQQNNSTSTVEVEHEMAHASQWHSADRMFAEITLAFLWINPFMYLWRKAIVELHEFLADRAVLKQPSDWEHYTRSLVTAVYQENNLQLTSNFSARILKKRIKMITRNNKRTYWNIAVLMLFAAFITVAFACTKDMYQPNDKAIVDTSKKSNTDEAPYVLVDNMPEFNGGLKSLMEYIAKNKVYPTEAKENNIEGRVFVRLVIAKDGSATNVSVIKSVHPLLDAEAIKVIKEMPKWTPGSQGGKKVNVWYTIPVAFFKEKKVATAH